MRKSKFTEEQIAFALKQAESGTSVEEVCRKMGMSQATFYLWRKKFGGLGVSELRRLRQLEEENRKLKQLGLPRRAKGHHCRCQHKRSPVDRGHEDPRRDARRRGGVEDPSDPCGDDADARKVG
jgi:putative transposase